jgi:hypothetical protein
MAGVSKAALLADDATKCIHADADVEPLASGASAHAWRAASRDASLLTLCAQILRRPFTSRQPLSGLRLASGSTRGTASQPERALSVS